MTTKDPQKSPCVDDVTEAEAVPSFDNIESALKGFRKKIFDDLKLSTEKCVLNNQREEDSAKKKCVSNTNDNNTATVSTSADSSVVQQKEKESSGSVSYPTNCRFCGGILRAINKHREDKKLTLQCRRRKCMKSNGLTADENAKQHLSKLAKPKAPQIDYGWYLSDPVRHSYKIFADRGDSSDLEVERSNLDVRPIVKSGNIMLRVFGQRGLAKLL